MGGVEAADVEGRIGFGVALGLRFLQHIGEGAMLLLHLRQDVIAGAVEDAVDAPHLVGGQRFAQRLDDGNAAGDRRLEVERDAVLLGQARQLGAMLGQQRLVGGHDVLAGPERGFDGAWAHPRRRRSVRRPRRWRDRGQRDGIVEPGALATSTPRGFASCARTPPATTMRRPTLRRARRRGSQQRSRPAPTVPSPATPSLNGSCMD